MLDYRTYELVVLFVKMLGILSSVLPGLKIVTSAAKTESARVDLARQLDIGMSQYAQNLLNYLPAVFPDFRCDEKPTGTALTEAQPSSDITGLLEGLDRGSYILPAGTFLAKNVGLRDGVRLYGQDPQSTVIRLPNGSIDVHQNQTHVYLIDLTSARDITLGCLALDANKAGQILPPGDYKGEENGGWHAIQANGARNILLVNLIARNAGTDGMNIGDGATNVIAVNTVFDSNRRQGVSVKKVSGLHFKNSIFSNTAGQNPQAGVDIEGNSPGDSSGDITFQQSKFLNNAGAGLMIDQHGSNLNGLLVEECEFTGTRGIEVKGRKDGVAAVFTQIMIRNSTIKGNSILGGSGRMGGGGKHVNTTMDGNIAGGRILITKAAAGSSFRITNNNLPNGDASIVLRDNEPDITVTRTGNRQD